MQGGTATKLNKLYKIPDMDQGKIKMKNTDLMDGIKTKNNNLLNQSFKNKTQNAYYLIKYFEGMILNYIKLYEFRGENINKLRKIITNNINKIKGGGYNINDKYPYYQNDETKPITVFYDNIWKDITINIHIAYKTEYKIHIIHDSDDNKLDLIVDLQNNIIVDNISKSYNLDICENTKNINNIIDNIIKILIKYKYDDTNININVFNDTNNDMLNDIEHKIILFSTISLLIMILTIRNNTDIHLYKLYNTTNILSDICKNLINEKYDKPYNKFHSNNMNMLTYLEKNHMLSYTGDCALNVLVCIKTPEIRELFVDKISYSQNKQINTSKNELYYIDEINKIFNELLILNGFEYIEQIKNLVNDYHKFTNFICGNEYIKFKNDVLDGEDNFQNLDSKKDFINNCNILLKLINIFRNNLFGYNITNDEANEICETIDKYKNDLIVYMKNINNDNTNINIQMINNFINIVDIIIKNNHNSFNVFYINLLISLLLTKHKINYLLDEVFIDFFKYSKNKTYFIKRFRNVSDIDADLNLILPEYQDGNNEDDKYLFMYCKLEKVAHAVLLIININKYGNKKMYLYDLNDLILYSFEEFKENNYFHDCPRSLMSKYILNNNFPNWIIQKYNNNLLEYYLNEIPIKLKSIDSFGNDSLINIIESSVNSIFKNNEKTIISDKIDLPILLSLNYNDYNKVNFNFNKYIKKSIFNDLIINCDNMIYDNPKKEQLVKYLLELYNYINEEIIENDKYNLGNLLFAFIKYLVYYKYLIKNDIINYRINCKNIYNDIIYPYFIDIYYFNYNEFMDYLDIYNYEIFKRVDTDEDDIKGEIYYILSILDKNNKNYAIVKGGNINNNNFLIKKILIILLIVVIIIIVILIVLLIINKYKNKELRI